MLGQISKEALGKRDAFHSACILAVGVNIKPGDSVRFVDREFKRVEKCGVDERHGIADPFVGLIRNWDYFWVLLNPNSTRNLQHHFEVTIAPHNQTPDPKPIPPKEEPEEEKEEWEDEDDDDSVEESCCPPDDNSDEDDDYDDDRACRGCY